MCTTTLAVPFFSSYSLVIDLFLSTFVLLPDSFSSNFFAQKLLVTYKWSPHNLVSNPIAFQCPLTPSWPHINNPTVNLQLYTPYFPTVLCSLAWRICPSVPAWIYFFPFKFLTSMKSLDFLQLEEISPLSHCSSDYPSSVFLVSSVTNFQYPQTSTQCRQQEKPLLFYNAPITTKFSPAPSLRYSVNIL